MAIKELVGPPVHPGVMSRFLGWCFNFFFKKKKALLVAGFGVFGFWVFCLQSIFGVVGLGVFGLRMFL